MKQHPNGTPLSETEVVVTILYSLLESYETPITTLEGSDKLDLATVTNRLLGEEATRTKGARQTTQTSTAFQAGAKSYHKTGTQNSKSPGETKKGRCHKCGKRGYWRSECSNKNNYHQVNVARLLGVTQTVSFITLQRKLQDWMVDSLLLKLTPVPPTISPFGWWGRHP
ncbi:hypothetical protein DFS34DRAFT_591537 [Phlyctochytrium arcticum]|nr:hypothetical protein DFS34DRAFT_591537 [Phlyctochytrium arcticum]